MYSSQYTGDPLLTGSYYTSHNPNQSVVNLFGVNYCILWVTQTERSKRTKRGGCFDVPSLRYGATDHTVRD